VVRHKAVSSYRHGTSIFHPSDFREGIEQDAHHLPPELKRGRFTSVSTGGHENFDHLFGRIS
jgi:hypothetical protein